MFNIARTFYFQGLNPTNIVRQHDQGASIRYNLVSIPTPWAMAGLHRPLVEFMSLTFERSAFWTFERVSTLYFHNRINCSSRFSFLTTKLKLLVYMHLLFSS